MKVHLGIFHEAPKLLPLEVQGNLKYLQKITIVSRDGNKEKCRIKTN